jgi:20S proteasome alpha/beta subunit
VTIAAGFVCMDGVVLCADTQETIPGYTKNSTEKIKIWYEQNFTLAITGAGHSEVIETLSQRINKAAMGEFTPDNCLYGDRAKELIEEAVLSFFERYLLPYPEYERPDVALLIAIQCHHNRYLLKAVGNTVRDLDPGISTGADCIGSGVLLAHSLIEKLYNPFLELDDLIITACYIAFQAKRWVDGCGGNTDILVLTDELRTSLSSSEIAALEKLFGEYDTRVGHVLTAVTNQNVPGAKVARDIKKMSHDLLEVRQQVAKNAPRLVKFFQEIRAQKSKRQPFRK